MSKPYAHPEVLVSTAWVDEHRSDTGTIRIAESDEDVLLYESEHIPEAVKIDWINDLNDPVVRDYIDQERFAELCSQNGIGNYNRTARYRETLANGKQYFTLEYTEKTIFDNTPVYTVPEGHYFAMGDNRDKSKDSRYLDDVGFIPRQNLVGRAEVLFFSVDGSVWEFWKWAKTLRFDRFYQGIE